MEGKLKAILRVSLALTIALSLGLLVAFPVSAANGILATFPEPGEFTFEVPDGVTSITIEAWGAGGGGGGSTNAGFLSGRCGAGGGGGAYASVTLPVTQGQDLRVVVGAGGIGVWGGDGDEGGSSFVTLITDVYDPPHDPLVLAAGGSGGTANTAGGKPPGGPGGQAGESTGDPPVFSGDPGEPGATCFTSVSGAGGAGAYGGGSGGASRTGADISADGNPGNAPGGGGGGARTSQFDGERAGGDGADGRVVITWEGPVEPVCPTISPPTRQYDLANPNDVTTEITWHDASKSITSIHDGSSDLTSGTDYTVSYHDGTATLTIKEAYLAVELTEAGDMVVLTITFDICAPVPFTITAIDMGEEECAILSPTTGRYDLANPGDVMTIITWNDASITSIQYGSADLAPGTDYTLSYHDGTATLTIREAYLALKLTEAGDMVVLTINCDICAIPLTITAIDTEEQVCPTISPPTRQYDLANPNDVTTEITWHDASKSITSIHDGSSDLTSGTDYTVSYHDGTATLTIKDAYLAVELTEAGDMVVLTITFDICTPVPFTITAIDTELPVGLTGYPVNKLAVMAPWIALGAAMIVGGSLLALRRRRRA